jgi:nucleotide-binding universal stress UspA family protein
MRILVPVDGSDTALRAVRFVIDKLAPGREGLQIHLLNVQPALPSAVTDFIDGRTVRDYHKEEGEKAMAGARRLLDAAGRPYESKIAIGDAAETIADYAKEIGCDAIVVSARGLGRVAGMLLGSTSTKLLNISAVPVTLVK